MRRHVARLRQRKKEAPPVRYSASGGADARLHERLLVLGPRGDRGLQQRLPPVEDSGRPLGGRLPRRYHTHEPLHTRRHLPLPLQRRLSRRLRPLAREQVGPRPLPLLLPVLRLGRHAHRGDIPPRSRLDNRRLRRDLRPYGGLRGLLPRGEDDPLLPSRPRSPRPGLDIRRPMVPHAAVVRPERGRIRRGLVGSRRRRGDRLPGRPRRPSRPASEGLRGGRGGKAPLPLPGSGRRPLRPARHARRRTAP